MTNKITPIHPGVSSVALDRNIPGLEEALEERRNSLWESVAILESLEVAIRTHLDSVESYGVPSFRLALRSVARSIDLNANEMDCSALLGRARELAQAENA